MATITWRDHIEADTFENRNDNYQFATTPKAATEERSERENRTMGESHGGQFLLLLWKNWTLQKKKKILTAFEIGLPTFFALVLLALRQVVEVETFADGKTWEPFSVDGLPINLVYMGQESGGWKLPYAPDNVVTRRIMDRVAARLNVSVTGESSFCS